MKYYKRKIAIKTAEVEMDFGKLNEVLEMAKKADSYFLEKFKILYPFF